MENNQAPVTPHPKKKKHGPIYYAFTVLGWILCAIVVWALIYETFFEEKREVPSEGIVTSTQSEEDPLLAFLDNPIRFEDSYWSDTLKPHTQGDIIKHRKGVADGTEIRRGI